MRYFCLFLILCSFNHALPELKHSLDHAQKELAVAAEKVKQLELEIALAEIKQIEQDVQEIVAEEVVDRMDVLDAFSDHRETLSSIIHNHPICAMEAQFVMDQILTLITHIRDEFVD